MARLLVLGFSVCSLMLTACQQTKLGTSTANAPGSVPVATPPPVGQGPSAPIYPSGYPPAGSPGQPVSPPVSPAPVPTNPPVVAPPPVTPSTPVTPVTPPPVVTPTPTPPPAIVTPVTPPPAATPPPQSSVPPTFTPPATLPVTPETQTLPGVGPSVGTAPQAVVTPNFQGPIGAEWFNVQKAMPETIVPCAGANCPGQQAVLPPPPINEDCRVSNTCASSMVGQGMPFPRASDKMPVAAAPATPTAAPPTAAPSCTPIDLSVEAGNGKLDLLLVMDTSASMRGGHENGTNGELGLLIPDMKAFVKRLDPKVDIRIAMMLGHGPATARSPKNIHGKLFKADSSDVAVIDYTKIKADCNGNLDCAQNKISDIIQHKMFNLPNDLSDAQGEALFMSVYDGITNTELLRESQAQGFFREDAKLGLMFFSDEQEVCFDYTTTTDKPAITNYIDPTTHKWTKGQDPHEIKFYKDVCQTAANGKPLNAEALYEALKDLKKDKDGNKLVAAAVTYQDNNIPAGLMDAANEMEKGHGYLEFVMLTGGRPIDMAKVDRMKTTKSTNAGKSKMVINFSDQMADFGSFAANNMRFSRNHLQCSSDIHPGAVNSSKLKLTFIDNSKGTLATFSGSCAGAASCAFDGVVVPKIINEDGHGVHQHLEIPITEQMKNLLQERGFKKGQALITFDSVSSVDPSTGIEMGNR